MATINDQAEFVRTALRLPPSLHKKLLDSAQGSSRSFNAEIIARLESTYNDVRSNFESKISLAATLNLYLDGLRVRGTGMESGLSPDVYWTVRNNISQLIWDIEDEVTKLIGVYPLAPLRRTVQFKDLQIPN